MLQRLSIALGTGLYITYVISSADLSPTFPKTVGTLTPHSLRDRAEIVATIVPKRATTAPKITPTLTFRGYTWVNASPSIDIETPKIAIEIPTKAKERLL